MKDVRWFHGSQQSLPQGQLPTPTDRYLGRLNRKTQTSELHGCFFRLQPNQNGGNRSGKTSFVTSQWLFYYQVMSFELKNVGATYQRLMDKMFVHQIGRNVQVYVEDMLVKSIWENDYLSDLREIFDILRTYNMKLNPSKCAFGVTVGKFLGFMVSQKGIEVNPKKVRAITELAPPKTVKEV